jgi:molybdate transport repressor ModE-like protein
MPLSRVPDLPALELLLDVARTGSLGASARAHGISQPAASARVKTMERLIGVPLLERSPTGSRLTEAGRLVTGWAAPVIAAAQAMDAGVDALREGRDSRLTVAASMTIAEYLLPGWLVALRQDRAETAVSLQTGNSTWVAARVLAGAAGLGFVEGAEVAAGLDTAVVARDRLMVVVAPAHPWARRRRPLRAAELAATPLIQREPGSGTRMVLESALAAYGPLAAPLLELASTTAVKSAVRSGAGPAVLSSLAITAELSSGQLRTIEVGGLDLTRRLRAVWPAGTRPAGPARDLLSLTRAPRAET